MGRDELLSIATNCSPVELAVPISGNVKWAGPAVVWPSSLRLSIFYMSEAKACFPSMGAPVEVCAASVDWLTSILTCGLVTFPCVVFPCSLGLCVLCWLSSFPFSQASL